MSVIGSREALLHLAEYHERQCCLHTTKTGICSIRRCLIRGGWDPKQLGDFYHLATCEAHETATALRELAAQRTPQATEVPHE
jgi:hypothetical protein